MQQRWAVVCDVYVSHWPDEEAAKQHAERCNKGLTINKCKLNHRAELTDLKAGRR